MTDLLTYQRRVFLGAGPPAVAAAPPDVDGDGIPNASDGCPATPRGADVDSRGCWVLTDLRFASDSAAIDEVGSGEVAKISAVLASNPDLRIRIDGYTDSTGSPAYNRTLSARRASAVRESLVNQGVDPARLEAHGFGEQNPVASNDTPEGRDLNRRIEFSVVR